jgi:hypothetical protein
MEIITKDEFTELGNFLSANCVSIYLPTHTSGFAVNERYDQIVFKNNLQKAKNLMSARGVDLRECETILEPGFKLLNDEKFWNNQSGGLAVFLSNNLFKYYKISFSVKEELMVNNSFLLTPLLPVLERKHRFYLLVLSKNNCKFYEADQFGMRKLEVEGLPYGINDVIHFEEKDKRQTHRRAGAGAGERAVVGASFHGHGSGLADEEEYMQQYFREVDQTLWSEVLHNQHVPLMLAAVDYEIALYKQVSNYKHICENNLPGNFDHEDRHSLYLKAKEKLTGYFKEYSKTALKNFYDNSASGLSSSAATEVIPAAHYAQVSDLFIERNTHIWGSFNDKENKIVINETRKPNDECLINRAILKTIVNGGEVHILDREKMPTSSPIAAFLRFAI